MLQQIAMVGSKIVRPIWIGVLLSLSCLFVLVWFAAKKSYSNNIKDSNAFIIANIEHARQLYPAATNECALTVLIDIWEECNRVSPALMGLYVKDTRVARSIMDVQLTTSLAQHGVTFWEWLQLRHRAAEILLQQDPEFENHQLVTDDRVGMHHMKPVPLPPLRCSEETIKRFVDLIRQPATEVTLTLEFDFILEYAGRVLRMEKERNSSIKG